MGGQLLFTIGVPGKRLPEIQRNLGRFSAGCQDLRVPFRDIVDDFEEVEAEQFRTLGAAESAGWAPLSDKYAVWKEKHFPGQPLLVASGRMRAALTGTTADSVREIQPLLLRMGVDDSKLDYPKYHNSGTLEHFELRSRVPGFSGMPRRPPIEFGETVRQRWILIIRRYLVLLARGGGAGTDADSIGARA